MALTTVAAVPSIQTRLSAGTGRKPLPWRSARVPAASLPFPTESSWTAPPGDASAVAEKESVSEYTPPVAKTWIR